MKNNLTGNSAKTLKSKKKQVIEKIALALKNKYNKLFNEKGYTILKLHEDLEKLISDNDLLNFDYNMTMIKVEKAVLEILTKLESLVSKGGIDMKRVNELIKPTEQHVVPKQIDEKKDKLNEIKEKENSEWALIAKHNYNKHIQDEKEKKTKEHEKKLELKKILDEQIKEKNGKKVVEKKEAHDYMNIKKAETQSYDIAEKVKQCEKVQKTIDQKISQEKILCENKKQKEEMQKQLNEIDKNMLDKAKRDLQHEQDRLTKKRQDEKDRVKQILDENREREITRQNEKEKERLDNIKAQEEYSNYIEKQEQERNQKLKEKIDRVSNLANINDKTEKEKTAQKEGRYLKEQELNEKK
jgi:hypothetical protein